jgi:uncharacterized protein (TIGR02145 family)
MKDFKINIYRTTSGCTPSCDTWSYTYTAWSAWSTCVEGLQSRTRTKNGSRTCTLEDCSTNIETSSTVETESQSCIAPCPNCVAHDVDINSQIWTGCNLNVDRYRNNELIPQITDAASWTSATTGAWCYYNFDPSNEATYGKLYNWYAVKDPRGLAPVGYHVPTATEYIQLITFLAGSYVGNINPIAGGKMKEEGLCHWQSPNTGATNSSRFTGLPGGMIQSTFSGINSNALFWTSDYYAYPGSTSASMIRLDSGNDSTHQYGLPHTSGLSVRLVRD